MRRTDSNIWHRVTDLMRSASLLLLSALTVLAVVSCSGGGDEPGTPGTTPGNPDNNAPILFSASHEANTDVTRSESPLELKVKSFIVYGYKNSGADYSGVQKVFPGYIVKWYNHTENTTTTNTDGWEYVNQQPDDGVTPEQTIKYWDMSATAYRFFGVAKGEGEYQTEETSDGGQFKLSFNLDATSEAGVNAAPYFSKLWFSTNNYEVYPDREFGKPVRLLFLKPFARVRFMFTQSNPKAVLLLENKSFGPKITNTIIDKCKLTVTYPLKGAQPNDIESYEITGPDPEEVTDPPTVTEPQGVTAFTEDYSETVQRWYNVYAPQNNLGVFTLRVTVNGAIKEVDVPAEYMKWEPGYQYTYVFKITDMGGVEIDLVESAFSTWNEIQGSTLIHNW